MSTIYETIATLEEYNKWRRGDETIPMPDPFEIGVGIGDAVRLLRELAAMTARAEKAEADSKRLDWLESNKGIRWQQWNDILVELDRSAIDAAMKEASK